VRLGLTPYWFSALAQSHGISDMTVGGECCAVDQRGTYSVVSRMLLIMAAQVEWIRPSRMHFTVQFTCSRICMPNTFRLHDGADVHLPIVEAHFRACERLAAAGEVSFNGARIVSGWRCPGVGPGLRSRLRPLQSQAGTWQTLPRDVDENLDEHTGKRMWQPAVILWDA
jgi:hypothetical protein